MDKGFYKARITERVHQCISPFLEEGAFVIDGTVGNGYDTEFLAKQIGPKGVLIGVDIQQEAIYATKSRLEAKIEPFLRPEIMEIVLGNHEDLPKIIGEIRHKYSCVNKMFAKNLLSPQIILFNLGYLPGSDKILKTNDRSTETALKASMNILAHKGILSIVTYPGHVEGKLEDSMVMELLKELPAKEFDVIQMINFNKSKNAPKHYMVYKH